MKRFVFASGLLMMLVLAVACGGSVEPAAVESPAEPEIEPVAVVEEEPAESMAEEEAVATEEVVVAEPTEVETEVEAEVAQIVIDAAEIVNPMDFDRISQTGRPQFLNSYANW